MSWDSLSSGYGVSRDSLLQGQSKVCEDIYRLTHVQFQRNPYEQILISVQAVKSPLLVPFVKKGFSYVMKILGCYMNIFQTSLCLAISLCGVDILFISGFSSYPLGIGDISEVSKFIQF